MARARGLAWALPALLPAAALAQTAPPTAPPAAPPGSKVASAAMSPAAPGAQGSPAAAGDAAPPEKKIRKFWIDGKYRELKKGEVRPYVAPTMLPEPEIAPSQIKVIEMQKQDDGEPQALARPYYGAPMIGTINPGARLPVRGEYVSKNSKWCHGKRWLAVSPFGWVCADHGKPTDQPAMTESVLQIVPGERVPFRYVMVSSKEPMPMWTTLDDLKSGAEPERQLARGDSIAIDKIVKHEGESYYQSAEGKILPIKGTYHMEATSQWHGIVIDDKMHLPFGWILGDPQNAYESPQAAKTPVAKLKRRTRVDILAEQTVAGKRYLQVRVSAMQQSPFPYATAPVPGAAPPAPAPGSAPAPAPVAAAPAPAPAGGPAAVTVTPVAPAAPPAGVIAVPSAPVPAADTTFWVLGSLVNEVSVKPRPPGINPGPQWIDADLGEQVLVAYENDKPVYATLVSSGKNNATPLGNYPVWARVTAITMKSQPYDDNPYFVNMVPWSSFFQAHNAIHGAYWHDRFGAVKSHGCINVAPLDARFVFEWLKDALPPGWTSVRPTDLRQAPSLHVYNSHDRVQFRQDRPIGPPDREDEAERLDAAEKRRAELGIAAPGAPGAPGAPAAPAAAPAAPAAPVAPAVNQRP